MASSSITRRSIMTAMAVAPIVISAPALAGPVPATRAWDAAFAEWERAHHAAFVAPSSFEDDDMLCNAENLAWGRLMRMPAPDNKALHWKINFLWGDSNGNEYADQWSQEIVGCVVADAKRLAGA